MSAKGRLAGPWAIRPGLGRKPMTEQKLAGLRKLPPRSLPVASQTWPAASAAAEPPDEPPGVRAPFHGFCVCPKTSLKVCDPAPSSGVLALATTTAPLVSRRSTR